MGLVCNKPGCTLAQTGICILENDPETCPDRLELAGEATEQNNTSSSVPNTADDGEVEYFNSSYTLSAERVQELMNDRYCKVVGILGVSGTGKTACLVSLYLLLSRNKLTGFEFRNSKSIMAFEEISRGAKWTGNTDAGGHVLHTAISDERTSGFLHLRLCPDKGQAFDLLLPDLSGEWTRDFIEKNRSDRFSFLKSAENLWIFVNGEELSNQATRNAVNHKAGILFERVANFCGNNCPPITIVVSHKDKVTVVEKDYAKLLESAANLGLIVNIEQIASFSTSDDIKSGDGIDKLVKGLFTVPKLHIQESTPKTARTPNVRQMLNFGQNVKDNG